MPLLNNLLENREMSLEDGSFLMAPGREKEIREAAQGGRRLLPVSKNLGLCTSCGQTNTADCSKAITPTLHGTGNICLYHPIPGESKTIKRNGL